MTKLWNQFRRDNAPLPALGKDSYCPLDADACEHLVQSIQIMNICSWPDGSLGKKADVRTGRPEFKSSAPTQKSCPEVFASNPRIGKQRDRRSFLTSNQVNLAIFRLSKKDCF